MNPITGYTIQETLFTSSRSIVYRARRDADGYPVVLKVLNAEFPSVQQLVLLHREYRLTRELAMDGVIKAMGIERFGTSMAIVLEDFGAHSLAILRPRLKLGVLDSLSLAFRIADIIGRVHRRNIIHRDINLSNIIWNPDTDELKLIDFGIAIELSRESPPVLSPRMLEGTLPYISPEATGRMNRPIDYRTDFYSLGVMLYELFTGQLPFTVSDPMELVHCHIARRPVEPHVLAPHLPIVLSKIIIRLMAKCAEDRYQSAFALAADLRRCWEALRGQGDIISFEIGRGDFSERFQLPQKLYGRARQVDELLASFGRVAAGAMELVLVGGYPGIGKSALVLEVHKPIVECRGYFISGKFDQFNHSVPYASLVQAFRELARQLLTEPAEHLVGWKEQLLSELGSSIAVICEVIPEFELIVGPQSPPPELPLSETRNRFHLTFERLVRTVASLEHPLVIFLDDLQWADLSSLQLLERLLTDVATRHLLVIGAYRDNEVSASHPLLTAVAQMSKAGATVRNLALAPLSLEHCIQWLMETLNRESLQVEPLARLCLRKTEGNPFFLGQFLLSLYEQGMVAFDEKGGNWSWDMDRISHAPMSDNVLDLMVARIQGLPEETLNVLQLAACIGNTFELKILAIVATLSPWDAASALGAALQEGLLLPIGETYKFIEDVPAVEQVVASRGGDAGLEVVAALDSWQISYRFLHDRVQQATYSLIPHETRPAVHLRIGRLMLSSLVPKARDEQLFTIVGHLNKGVSLLNNQQERDELAALNLAAGRKAKDSAAYIIAKDYLLTAITLLGVERWMDRHELALELHTQMAESCFQSGDFESMEYHIAQVLIHTHNPLKKVQVYELKCLYFFVTQRFDKAIESGLEFLSQLDIYFPRPVTSEHIAAAFAEVSTAMSGRSINELAFLPAMSDPRLLAAMRLLNRFTSIANGADPTLFVVLIARQIVFALNHGNTGRMAISYSHYSCLLTTKGEFNAAYEFGRLALYVLEKYDLREHSARVLLMWNVYTRHFKEDLRESMRGCQDAYRVAIELGDIQYVGWAVFWLVYLPFFLGDPLVEVDAGATRWSQFLFQRGHKEALLAVNILHQAVQNLRGLCADPYQLVGTVYDDAKMTPMHRKRGHSFFMSSALFFRFMLCGLLGRHGEVIKLAAEEGIQRVIASGGSVFLLNYCFFNALAHLALQSASSPGESERTREQIETSLAKLKVWAETAPMNHAARYTLLLAEQSRVMGETEQARARFYRAIALAQDHRWLHDEALATERFALFLQGLGECEVARFFMAKARHLYQIWGAEAKVSEMDRAFPNLRALALALGGNASAAASLEHPASMEDTFSESAHSIQSLDLLSILKASQAISEEMVLKDLMEKLLRIVMENAGARGGLLMLEGERSLAAVARCSEDAREFTITLREDGAQAPVEFSQAIIRYVQRTHEVVVIEDASADNSLRSDPYITVRRPRSVLCIPILHQKKRAGILYLENELLANAFTPDRCKVLELLVVQAAISLENAKLYDTLEMKVNERTRALSDAMQRLRETQKQFIMQEKLASLGNITSGIAHEIRNPLNFVNNFSQLTMSLVVDLRDELEVQTHTTKPEIVRQLLDELQQSAEKTQEHGLRADRIIRAMLEHARSAPRADQRMNINAVVRECVHLSMRGYKEHEEGTQSAIKLQAKYDESIGDSLVAPGEIGRVIRNLVNNALYALYSRKEVRDQGFVPLLEVNTHNREEHFEIRIRDNGGGIPASVKEKIFTPFLTTKPPGEGTGLGLSISYDIVTGSGGRLEFSSIEGESTEFVVVLPKHLSPCAPAGGGAARGR